MKYFLSTVGGGSRMKTQEDSLNRRIDLIVASPRRLLMRIELGKMTYGDIEYVVSIFF
jgi:superfamily II DNA/RNA helicase